MSLFSGIKDAKMSEGGTYLKPGAYPEIEVLGFKAGRSRKGEDFVVASLKIGPGATGPECNPPGSVADWMVMMKHDSALGNVKAFLAAVAGCSPGEIDEEVAEASLGEEQPLAGLKVSADASEITTRSGGKFTKVRWYAHQPEKPAETPKPAAPPAKSLPFGKK